MYRGIIDANIPEADEADRLRSKEVDVAENFEDCVKLFGSEAKAVDLLNQKYKVNVQNELRREGRQELGLVETKNGGASKSKGIKRVA